jgi:hypothetical protein
MISGCPTISTYTFHVPGGIAVERSKVLVVTERFDAAKYRLPAGSV